MSKMRIVPDDSLKTKGQMDFADDLLKTGHLVYGGSVGRPLNPALANPQQGSRLVWLRLPNDSPDPSCPLRFFTRSGT